MRPPKVWPRKPTNISGGRASLPARVCGRRGVLCGRFVRKPWRRKRARRSNGRQVNHREREGPGHSDPNRAAFDRQCAPFRVMKAAPKLGQRSGMADKIRVLIADDHVTVREGLSAIIGRQPDMMIVGEAANGREAVELWRKQRP